MSTNNPQYLSGGGAAGTMPQLVETARESVIAMLRGGLNTELAALYPAYNPPPVGANGINLGFIPDDRYYISEVIDPLDPPACFVLAESSEHDLVAGQNFELTKHRLFVVLLVEDVEITRLKRAAERYGLAAWRVLHDRNFNNVHTFVNGFDYSAAYARNADAGTRNFRADVTLRVEARMYEPVGF